MGYRYIGSKTKILNEIVNNIKQLIPRRGTVADIMSGSGAVSLELRKRGYRVISNDVMRQAYHLTKAKVLLQSPPLFDSIGKNILSNTQQTLTSPSKYYGLIEVMNSLPPLKGYFYKEFSPDGCPENGSPPRKYFTSENAMKIDAIRKFIKKLNDEKKLTENEYSLLIHDLIAAVNDVANIAGTYGHFLSKFNSRAIYPLKMRPMQFIAGGMDEGHEIYNEYAEKVAPKIEADVCYIDPPYMKRQYAANYHVLETIAKEDEPEAVGLSGLRPWRDEYSDFCSKVHIRPAFEKIITNANCDNFIISYSSEGLLKFSEINDFLKDYGDLQVSVFSNKRFKSRNEDAEKDVTEYLFFLKRKNQ